LHGIESGGVSQRITGVRRFTVIVTAEKRPQNLFVSVNGVQATLME
jgi:hypothetical protein